MTLSDKIIHDLERDAPTFCIECNEEGKVSKTIELETENFFLEFDIDGRLKFYRKAMMVSAETSNPERQIDIEPELYIMSIAVWDNDGNKYEIEELDFDKKLSPHLMDLLEQTW